MAGNRKRNARRLGVGLATMALLVGLTALPSLATLAGSSFDTTNGDLTDLSLHDWNPPGSPTGNVGPIQPIDCTSTPLVNCGTDLIRSSLDNAFGQGAKEDTLAPTVVNGSIPPNKDDLRRFYVNKERATSPNCGGLNVNTCDYLYLAWERTNLLGSAHMDFEFNQLACGASPTFTNCSANHVTPVRTAGDVLITFDFGGSGIPDLGLLRWLTAAAGNTASQCEASNSLPCWGNRVDLTASGLADGSVNSTTVTDNNAPGNPYSLSGTSTQSTFGEAGVNLTKANLFPSSTCFHLGSAFLKSRSSGSSFTSELKDFVSPVPVNITNCGTVNIHKQDDVGAPLSGAVFTLFTDSAPLDGAPPHGPEDLATVPALTCTTGASGDCTIANVPFGNYWAVETTGVPNHTLAADQSFALTEITPNLTISLTFVDPRQPGAILVTKVGKNKAAGSGDQPLAGASFTVNGVTKTTDAQGHACFDGLTFGTYTVTENSPPTGYSADSTSKDVTVDHTASCSSGTPNGVTFTDKPLTDLSVTVTSEKPGATNSTIDCGSAGNSGSASDPASLTSNGLVPGTYTCTIVIDP